MRIAHTYSAHRPTELGRNDVATVDFDVSALSQRLDAVHFRVVYLDIFAIPKCRATQFRHFARLYFEIVVVPKRIAQIEKTVRTFDVSTFLKRAFAVFFSVDSHAFASYISFTVQRSFLSERLILNEFLLHSFSTLCLLR